MINKWENVLLQHFGEPSDQGKNGKKYVYNDTCQDGGILHTTLYHTAKIILQAAKNNHSINIHFVNIHLEELYTKVYHLEQIAGNSCSSKSDEAGCSHSIQDTVENVKSG